MPRQTRESQSREEKSRGYSLYYQEQIAILRQANSKQSQSQLATKIAEQWTNLKMSEKQEYENKASKIQQLNQQEGQKKDNKALRENKKKENQESIVDPKRPKSSTQRKQLNQSQLQVKKEDEIEQQNKIQSPQKPVIISQNQQLKKQGQSVERTDQQQATKKKVAVEQQLQEPSQQEQRDTDTKEELEVEIEIQQEEQKDEQQEQFQIQQNNIKQRNNQIYIDFFQKSFIQLKERFPKRSSQELTQAISLEWKRRKQQIKQYHKEQKKQVPSANKKGIIVIDGNEIQIPKKPIGQYLRFYQQKYQEIKDNDKSNVEVAKIIANIWKNLSADQKKPYELAFNQELIQYERQKTEFINKYGFFPQQQTSKKKKALEKLSFNAQNKKNPIKKKVNQSQGQKKTKKPKQLNAIKDDDEKLSGEDILDEILNQNKEDGGKKKKQINTKQKDPQKQQQVNPLYALLHQQVPCNLDYSCKL